MNQTGGFFYHYLGLRNSMRYWKSFQEHIESVLEKIQIKENERIAWIGVSGAYSLPKLLLRERLLKDHFIDIDPFAKWVFNFRIGYSENWSAENYLKIDIDPTKSAAESAEALNQMAVDKIIFCNILGQLPLFSIEKPKSYWIRYHQVLLDSIAVEVFSYHDLFTITGSKQDLDEIENNLNLDLVHSERSLMSELKSLALNFKQISYVDHFTEHLSSKSIHKCFWRKDRNSLHLIDCILWKKN